jgi:hypothetical protein
VSLIGKGGERAKESDGEQPCRELDRNDETLSMYIDHVDHAKRFDYYPNNIKWILEKKDHLLLNWGACVDVIFWKKQVRRGKKN